MQNPLITSWVLLVIAAINSTLGNIFLKKSQQSSTDESILSLLLNPWFFLGLVFYEINVILFAKALKRLPVSTAYPVLAGLSFLLLVVVARVFLEEKLSIQQMTGIVLVMLGLAFLGKQ